MEQLTAPLDKFKEREIEIITLMAEGLSNKEIGEKLFLAKETVRWYNKQIYSKLGTSRRVEAITRARQFGLIDDKPESASRIVKQKLPVTTGPFVGRDEELSDLAALLAKPEIRLLSIVAAGGMGKSRLSLELGHQIKNSYEHGAAFIDLTPIQNPGEIPTFAVASLGLYENSRQTPQEILFNYCREKSLLLIFDNFEDVLSEAHLLADILEVAPKVKIVVTTRERLNLRVETVYYLQPVMKSGGQLFQEVAMMMHPNLIIEAGEQDDIQRIVRVVGGLPLALILAATWLDMLTIPEIVSEIEANLDFLSSEMGDMPARQQSIQAVITPTWRRLNAREQKAFMWASVFRGGFTREAFQQVAGASLRTIQTLLRRSLLSQGNGRRYNLHPLIRQYAYEKLAAQQLVEEARHAHLITFKQVAQNQNDRMYSGHYLDALHALGDDHDNFLVALDWSLEENHVEDGIALVLNLCEFWMIRSHSKKAVSYIEQLLTFRQDAELYLWLGRFQSRIGRTENARNIVKLALSLAGETKATDTLAQGYYVLGYLHAKIDPAESEKLYEQALAIAKERNLPALIGACLISLGLIASENNNLIEASRNLEQAMEIYKKRGDLRGISMITYNMSLVYEKQGNGQKARDLCEHSLSLKRQIGDKAGVARRLSVLAYWDFIDEEFEQAHQYLAESVAICEELGEQDRLLYALSIQGAMSIVTGEYKKAQTIIERALELAKHLSDQPAIEWNQSNLGLLCIVQGKIEEAFPHILEAMKAIHQTVFDPWTCMIAYANYLWFQQDFEQCTAIVTTMSLELEQTARGYAFNNQYFLRPLIYRVQQRLGKEGWQAALQAASETTIEQQFEMIVTQLQI